MRSDNSRRRFITTTAAVLTGSVFFPNVFASTAKPRCILLRSGWQVENIGDIAHTPGALALLEKYVPDAEIIFWPFYTYLPPDEVVMLKRRFPKMRLVEGKLDINGKASTPALAAAIESADFFLHNSGPATLAWADAAAFRKLTGKSFGVYGVTYGLYGMLEKNTLSDASFVYFRDTVSLQKAKNDGIHAPIMEFSPDVVFALDVKDDARATAFLRANDLENGKFLCCIPKHRYTPAWLHVHKNRPIDQERNATNEAMKEHDHQPLREAITAVTRETDLKILICHEDETEMVIGKEWLMDKLPEDVKTKIVWLNRKWLVDEALSIYVRSAGLFGNEMHSPIMCIGNGVPAIVCRWEQQSSKGIMWADIGLGEWLFDFDNENDIKRLVPTVLAMAKDPLGAKAKAAKAREFVFNRLRETMKEVEKFSRSV